MGDPPSIDSSISSAGSGKELKSGLVVSNIVPTISGSLLRTGKHLTTRWKLRDPYFFELRGSVLLVFKENPREIRCQHCPIAAASRALHGGSNSARAQKRKMLSNNSGDATAIGINSSSGEGVVDWSHAYDLSAPDVFVEDCPSLSGKHRYAFRINLGNTKSGLGQQSAHGKKGNGRGGGGGGGRKELVLAATTEEAKNTWMEALQGAIRCKISTADFELLNVLGTGHFGKVFLVKPKQICGEHPHGKPKLAAGTDDSTPTTEQDDHHHHHAQHLRLTSSTSSSSTTSSSGLPLSPSSGGGGGGGGGGSCRCHCHHDLLAMKEIRISARHRPSFLMNERVAMSTLGKHPFIISLVTAFREKEFLYLGLEFARGGDLFEVLKRSNGAFFKPKQAAYVAAEVVLALEFAHKHNIIFRDLKPENVLIDAEGHVKLGDWGLAKRLNRSNDQRARTFCGTKAYIPPEVFKREGSSWAGDFWQLGTFLYELQAGYSPFYLPRNKQDPMGNAKDTIGARVMGGEFSFPFGRFDDNGETLIGQLLEVSEERRLTNWNDVKQAKFFTSHLADKSWDDVLVKKLVSPIKPKPTSSPPLSSAYGEEADGGGASPVANFSEEFTLALARWGHQDPFRMAPGHVANTLRDEGLYTDELMGFTYCRGSGIVEVEAVPRISSGDGGDDGHDSSSRSSSSGSSDADVKVLSDFGG